MNKIKNIIKEHKWMLILAFLTGALMVLPQVIFITQAGNDYKGINILATDNEANFLARFQEIAEGDWGFSDIFLTFDKNVSYQRPYLGQVIMYRFGQIFFLSTYQIHLLAKFILPAILFLMIYFFVLLFEPEKKIALASSAGIMLWYGISSISDFKSFLGNNLVISGPSVFSRPVIPVLGIIILFSFLSFFYLYIIQSKKRYYWLSGIFFGLSFYIYFFTWSFLTVFVFVSAFWFLVKKDWLNLKKILEVIFLGAFIALPYWFNFYKLINYQAFDSLAGQAGLVFSQSIIIGKYLIAALLLYFLLLYTKRIKGINFWFWSCLIVSFIVILNQQLITHRVLQPGHYHWYIIKPLTVILFIWFISNLIQNKCKKCFGLLVIILIAGGFYLLISQQIFIYYQFKDEVALYSQRYASIYSWLNQNTIQNQIIFSGILGINQRCLMSAYTHLDEYLYKNKALYPYSLALNKYILFLEYRLNKITPETAKELFFNDLRKDIFYEIYGYYYRITYLDKGESVPDERVWEIIDEYTYFYQQDLEAEFKKYPIDYMIWDRQLNPQWNLDGFDFLQLIHQVNNVGIYKFL